MRLAVFSDIHGNLEALEAVIEDMAAKRIDRHICLGDIVGYGADPIPCMDKVRSLPRINIILGNHDAAAAWIASPYSMNKEATQAILWTMEILDADNTRFLKKLPPVIKMGNMLFSHANPYNPLAWRYVVDRKIAVRSFSRTTEKLLFVGHSHRPLIITRSNFFKISFTVPEENSTHYIVSSGRQIINCGSIGQPRDGNPKASYVIHDTRKQTLEFRRVSYDHEKTAQKIKSAGLPGALSRRLSLGV